MGRSSLRRLVVLGVLVGAPRESAAQAALVLEAYAGERPADADRVLAPLRERLAHHGYAARPAEILAALGHRLPLPGHVDPAITATEIAERIDLGYKSALRGDYALAVHQLAAALETARENPARVVAHEGAREWLTKAIVGLAFARGRLGDLAGAAEQMAEQLRSFPEHPVRRDAFGPEAEKLYRAARKAHDAAPRGSLLVDVSRADAQIYINEAERGRGGTFHGDLAPGAYRVFVEAAGVGRRYAALVHAGQKTRLTIDWDTDARFTASPRWIGLVWPPGARDRSALLAQQLARGAELDEVIVLSIVRRGSRRLVIGHLFRLATGERARAGSIELRGRDAERLVALADYLATGERTRELALLQPRDEPRPRPGGGGASRAPVWASAGVAAAALGAGSYLVAIDDRGTCDAVEPVQCMRLHGTAPIGWTLIGGGVAAIGVGLYWYVARARTRAPGITIRRAPSGGVATIGWSF